jgi:phosphatidylethanolamine-binding protein (PEBP) family uncharacterized protein
VVYLDIICCGFTSSVELATFLFETPPVRFWELLMKLKSKDFVDNGNIASEFTCDGRNISPQLSWENVPEKTKSFALAVTDPDAHGGTWIHWLVHNISKELRRLTGQLYLRTPKKYRMTSAENVMVDLVRHQELTDTFSRSTP